MRSFWLVLKQQWTIEEISIFSNSSHLEWRSGLWDKLLKGTHPGTIPARFGLIWFSGFREEDLNVKVYDVQRMPSDGKRWIKKNHSFIFPFGMLHFLSVNMDNIYLTCVQTISTTQYGNKKREIFQRDPQTYLKS